MNRDDTGSSATPEEPSQHVQPSVEEPRLSIAALATASGASVETLQRLIGIGLLKEREGGFSPSDAARVRLLLALEGSGVPIGSLATAVAAGRISFDFLDALMPSPGRLTDLSYAEAAAQTGLERSLAMRARALLGTAEADDTEPIRDADLEIFRIIGRARAIGASQDNLMRVLGVFFDNLRKIVDAERDFVDEVLHKPFLAAGGSEAEMLGAVAGPRLEFRMLGAHLADVLHPRILDDAVFQNVAELIERVMTREGIIRPVEGPPPAIAFVDASGYTRFTEESGDSAAATEAGRLAGLAQETVPHERGHVVKLLGDGVMLHYPDPGSAVRSLLHLLDRGQQMGLPPLHAGLDAGPVIRRDGDYFGSVVNVAARAAEYARPDEVLATRAVVEAVGDEAGFAFRRIGEIALKNVRRPVELFQAGRATLGGASKPSP